MANYQINSIFLKTYITAVKFYKENYVLSAVGGNLNIYEINSGNVLCEKIFQGQSIHGIILNDKNQCVLYGGKHFCLLQLYLSNNVLKAIIQKQFSIADWILKIIFLNQNLLILTAHNNAILLSLQNGQELMNFISEEKCILYSGEIVCDKTNEVIDCIILGGTVFSDIIIWRTEFTDKCNKILHRLKGHKGVIFSIVFNQKLQKISSTSDDRSLRIWNIQRTKQSTNWKDVTISLQNTCYGHMDRVRASAIVEKYDLIISIGEDSMICLWDLNGQLLSKKSSHQAGPIWDLDVNNKRRLIVTGGSDGGLLLHSLLPNKSLLQTLSSDCGSTNLFVFNPRKILYTSCSTLLCISHEGYLLKFCSESSSWLLIDKMPEMFSYCVVDSKFNKTIICGLDGTIRIYEEIEKKFKLLIKKVIFEERIVSVSIAQIDTILICSVHGEIFLYTIKDDDFKKQNKYKVPLSSEPWFTAADLYQDYVIIGDRKGNIHLYNNEYLPIHTIYKVHCHLGVTNIIIQNDLIISTGRNGKFAVFKICARKLVQLSCTKIDLKWIDRSIFINNVQLLCGFIANKFIICTVNEVVWEVDCGGGHRSWDMCINDNNINLTFIKNGTIYTTSAILTEVLVKPLENSFISREINCLTSLIFNNKFAMFVSGGEDTVLNISIFNVILNKLEKLFTIQTHLSSIKDVKVIKLYDDNRLASFYIISCGSRAQICISKVDIDISNSDEPLIQSQYLGEHMLNNSDILKRNKSTQDEYNDMRYMSLALINQEIQNFTKDLILVAGCSDGFLRLFKLDKNNDLKIEINLVALELNGKCILNVTSIQYGEENYIILTMDSEGKVQLWSFLSDICKVHSIISWKLHENGINSYDVMVLEDDTFILATGGDDNSLKLTLFTISTVSDKLNANKIDIWENKTVHCAQITGITIFKYLILITSIDQRISLFKCKANKDEGIKCEFLDQRLTTVADIKGLRIICKTEDYILICIYGRGIDIMKFIVSNEDKDN